MTTFNENHIRDDQVDYHQKIDPTYVIDKDNLTMTWEVDDWAFALRFFKDDLEILEQKINEFKELHK